MQKAAAELQKTADEASGQNPVRRGVQRVQIEAPAIDVRGYLSWGSASVIAFAGQAMLVVFFVFFLLASGDLFKRKLVKLAGPSLEKKKITVQILNEIDSQIERFLLVRVVTSSSSASPRGWRSGRSASIRPASGAIAAGVFNSIPYFGPVIVAAGTAVVGFLQFGTIGMALYVVRHHAGDHEPRRMAADAVAHEPHGTHQRGRDLRRADLLELRLGDLGNAAGGADAGRREGVLRSDRGPQADRRAPRRVGRASERGRGRADLVGLPYTNVLRSVRPRAASSGFQRSPTFAIRCAHVVEAEVFDARRRARPRSMSSGVDTVASGVGRTE